LTGERDGICLHLPYSILLDPPGCLRHFAMRRTLYNASTYLPIKGEPVGRALRCAWAAKQNSPSTINRCEAMLRANPFCNLDWRAQARMFASRLRNPARSVWLLATFRHVAYLLQGHRPSSELGQAFGQGLAAHMGCQTRCTNHYQWVQGLAARPLPLQAFAAHRRCP
jgi:hypothetical protein